MDYKAHNCKHLSAQMANLDLLVGVEDFRRLVTSFLWFTDLRELTLTCKTFLSKLGNDEAVHNAMFCRLLIRLGRWRESESEIPRVFGTTACKDIVKMASRLCSWPTRPCAHISGIFDRFHRYGLKEEEVSGRQCVLFTGRRGMDRTFVSDDYFPVTRRSSFTDSQHVLHRGVISLPFSKPVTVAGAPGYTLSCVSYFEITILDPVLPDSPAERRPPGYEDDSDVPPPCVAIGMARPGFDLFHMQPGWDAHSFGIHGDDGLLFFGDSAEGIPLSSNEDSRYGVGDTVGIGIVSSGEEGGLIFTKNGCLVALYFPDSVTIATMLITHAWFPAVGTDCYNPIACNFGVDRSFAFDIVDFERRCLGSVQLPAIVLRGPAHWMLSANGAELMQAETAVQSALNLPRDLRLGRGSLLRLCRLVQRGWHLHTAEVPLCCHPWFSEPYQQWREYVAYNSIDGISRFFDQRLLRLTLRQVAREEHEAVALGMDDGVEVWEEIEVDPEYDEDEDDDEYEDEEGGGDDAEIEEVDAENEDDEDFFDHFDAYGNALGDNSDMDGVDEGDESQYMLSSSQLPTPASLGRLMQEFLSQYPGPEVSQPDESTSMAARALRYLPRSMQHQLARMLEEQQVSTEFGGASSAAETAQPDAQSQQRRPRSDSFAEALYRSGRELLAHMRRSAHRISDEKQDGEEKMGGAEDGDDEVSASAASHPRITVNALRADFERWYENRLVNMVMRNSEAQTMLELNQLYYLGSEPVSPAPLTVTEEPFRASSPPPITEHSSGEIGWEDICK